jgi:hypothetical protein
VLNGVDSQKKLFKRHSSEYRVDPFSAKHDERHFQSVIQTQPGPTYTPFLPAAAGKLEDRGAMRRNAKPFQNGGRNNGVSGPRIHERAKGLKVLARGIA